MIAEFERFGAAHVAALALTALAAAALVRYGRARRGRPAAQTMADCLAFLIVAAFVASPFQAWAFGTEPAAALPLQLCDAAGFATIAALGARRPFAFELAYFWGLSGTLQALLTPSVAYGFAHPDTIRYWALHGGIVAAVLYLGPGLGMRPRRGAVLRVVLATAAYTAVVGAVDWAFGANYMWLREKPPGSVLDLFGPWPWYIGGAGALAVALFLLLDLPYRMQRRKQR